MRRAIPAILVLVVTGVAVALWFHRRPAATAPAAPPQIGTSSYGQARADAQRLPVRGWEGRMDFIRYRFGEAWSDDVDVEFGHNGCNTRDDVLRRDLADLVVRPGTCFAQTGTLHDPYTGVSIAFVRGPATSDAVQIDHVVSLSDAWFEGAREWDDQRRRDFANDPRNLLAVDGKANSDKAFRDIASWLPPNAAFRCEFVSRVVAVKSAYRLSVSAKEKGAIVAALEGC